MTTYDRLLFRQLVSILLKTVVSLLLIFVLVDILTNRQSEFVSYGVPISVIARYYLDFSPMVLFQFHVVAIAVLVSVLMVMGRAAQDNEITACLAGGVGLWRVARAPVLFALLVASLVFLLEDQWAGNAIKNSYSLKERYFERASDKHREGVSWTNLDGKWTCHIMKFNRRALTGQDVYLYAKSPEKVEEIRAHRIYWDAAASEWVLEDGRWVVFTPQAEWEQQINRITQIPAPFKEPPAQLFALDQPAETKSAMKLLSDIQYAESLNMPVHTQWLNFHGRFARPFVCVIMAFIAIPFAMRIRRGGVAVGFGVSIGIALLYTLLYYAGLGLGYIGTLPPLAAVWLANAVFACVAVALCWRAPS